MRLFFSIPLMLKHPRPADFVASPRLRFRKAYDVASSTLSNSRIYICNEWLLEKSRYLKEGGKI
jgi:hypothetical protein